MFYKMTRSLVVVMGFLIRVSLVVIPRLSRRISFFYFDGMKDTLDSACCFSNRLIDFFNIEEPVNDAAVVSLAVLKPHYE